MSSRPALRRDLEVVTLFRSGVERTVVKDAFSTKYYDFGPGAGRILRLLDGTRTVEEVLRDACAELRGAALSRSALDAFLAGLAERDLLEGDARAFEERLVARSRRRARDRRFELRDI